MSATRRWQGAIQEVPVLHDEGVVEPKLVAQPFDVGLGALLSQHVVDGIADEPEQGEGDQTHGQQYDDRLGHPADDEGKHLSLLPLGWDPRPLFCEQEPG